MEESKRTATSRSHRRLSLRYTNLPAISQEIFIPPLTYLERLCIAWFLWWRILRTSFFVNLGLGVILGWWGTAIGLQHETIVGIGYVLGFAFTMMLVLPWVLGMLPHNQFSGFPVEIVRDGQT